MATGAGRPARRAVVLAAGEGTRLRPLTYAVPKALVEIGGIPLLDHLLCLLAAHGVERVAINLHHRPEEIVRFVGTGQAWGLDVHFAHEARLLGSGGTLRALASFLTEPFVLLYGDVLTDADLGGLVGAHRAHGAVLTCLLHRVPDPWTKGVAELRPDGRVDRFVEKPRRGEEPGDLAAAGIYVAQPDLLAVVPARLPCDFGADVVPAALATGWPVQGIVAGATTYLRDIGTPAALAGARQDASLGRIRLLSHRQRGG